jgi:hypothetical protein
MNSFELLAPSVDHGQIVIGKLTPLLFDLALCLFPISFDAVPVHSRRRPQRRMSVESKVVQFGPRCNLDAIVPFVG